MGALRRGIVPRLRTYPSLRLWHAGSPAADVYATAIVLREEGLLTRARIYATADSEDQLAELR
ncbi:MAG TPA: protein-glutamate O-methyltransferase CheR, partial [Kofleriaceae bacterium]|nr:protein-glutamate O-methyltransferase CheR [Kofleriaceae bacterium]